MCLYVAIILRCWTSRRKHCSIFCLIMNKSRKSNINCIQTYYLLETNTNINQFHIANKYYRYKELNIHIYHPTQIILTKP